MAFSIRRIGEEPSSRRWKRRFLGVMAAGIRFGRPAVQALAAWREAEREEQEWDRRRALLKKATVVLLAVLGAAVTAVIILKILLSLNLISARSLLSLATEPLPEDGHGHTNVLLLGQGDETHDGFDLTDTIMLASIDPDDTQSAVLLSIPRDLYLYQVEGVPNGRVNELHRNLRARLEQQGADAAASSHAAMKEMATVLGGLLGVDIHGAIKVDFVALEEGVDAIGGLDIDVPYTIVDNEYPARQGTGYAPFTIAKGLQHIDGATALKYARSRHTTSDFGRSARQQQLISAIVEKLKHDGVLTKPGRLLDLLGIAGKRVESTLTFGQLASLAAAGKDLDRSRMIMVQLSDQNGLYGSVPETGGFLYTPPRDQFGGAAVLLPVSIPEFPITWKQIRTFVDLLLHRRTMFLPFVDLEIRNVAAPSGAGQRLAWELGRYGFTILGAKNAPRELRDRGLEQSVIIAPRADRERLAPLGTLLGMPVTSDTDALLPDVATGSTLILLGGDYDYAPLQDLLPRLTP